VHFVVIHLEGGIFVGMDVVLPALGVAFAAFCLWLTVRIVNRRERWAKWTAAGLAIVLAYPISFGPACWISSHLDAGAGALAVVYDPLVWVIARDWRARYVDEAETPNLDRIGDALEWYAESGAAQDWRWHANYVGIEWRYDGWIWSRWPKSTLPSPVY
jgi:hypothetical protein